MMRLFFGLWPDEALRHELATLARQVQGTCGGRRPRDEALHLTLAFLGDVSPARASRLITLTRHFGCPTGQWTLDHLGYFRRGGILWLGSQSPAPGLEVLYQTLWKELTVCGFTPPRRPFLPHVTLLRKALHPPATTCLSTSLEWRFNQLALIHSVPQQRGGCYVTLARTALPKEST
ncbi:RNA 2',3'-cyclic phosphodiesterase [Halomonas sp. LBP4]|uniref:RNA 2',3'-cyclic phosphodiesterase n=1 Tax=Halomonas sp. LBP4 TaxID=2044917 RepID=UPI000D764029|nr:RNA 2',3'-cyclic phosphodiesterase [Halomonas sp. LBP4]PXX96527.1 RNA 2',3'-cyclic phosphodiesterase [Halomonas sp. LBP4]